MSVFLNLAGAVLVLPIVALAGFFLLVEAAARQTLGSMLRWLGAALLSLPGNLAVVVAVAIGMLLGFAGIVYLMLRFRFLLPLTIVVLGGAASAHVLWATGMADAWDNPLLWAAALGMA